MPFSTPFSLAMASATFSGPLVVTSTSRLISVSLTPCSNAASLSGSTLESAWSTAPSCGGSAAIATPSAATPAMASVIQPAGPVESALETAPIPVTSLPSMISSGPTTAVTPATETMVDCMSSGSLANHRATSPTHLAASCSLGASSSPNSAPSTLALACTSRSAPPRPPCIVSRIFCMEPSLFSISPMSSPQRSLVEAIMTSAAFRSNALKILLILAARSAGVSFERAASRSASVSFSGRKAPVVAS